ncbi:MAG: EVE domain-containing protein [Chitinophagaceae bacterium]|nr:EVE domain-containing protein [Chitinophagaceae bacterium]
MNYWLVKSDPEEYGWQDLIREKQTCWSGVRNFTARNYLLQMKKNDKVFFYHSSQGKQIVGIATVVKEAYPDPTTEDNRWMAVDLKPVKQLKKPVTLEEIKKEKKLSAMALVRMSRLSVQPVSESEWNIILKMAGEKMG